MSVRHHLADDLILAYGTGELDEATGLLVAAHLALCPQCRRALEAAEAMGGAFLDTLPVTEVAEDALDSVLTRIDRDVEAAADPAPAKSRANCVLPQPLRDYAGGDVDAIKWSGLGGGVRHFLLRTGASKAKARLLHIPAGAKVPEHSHGGRELTLVLAGAFYDDGAWFRRGDVEEADATVEHQPVAGPEEACICLAVTDAPLKFRGLLTSVELTFDAVQPTDDVNHSEPPK